MDFAVRSETFGSDRMKTYSQLTGGKYSFTIKNFNVDSKEIKKRASEVTDEPNIINKSFYHLNGSPSKISNISTSLVMINNKMFQKNNCSSPIVLAQLEKGKHEIDLKFPNRLFNHSKTFTKSYPNLNQTFATAYKHLDRSYKDNFILKSKDDREKLLELLLSFNLGNKPQCCDQTVDTSDLQNRQDVIEQPTGNPSNTFSYKSKFNFKNISSHSNLNKTKANSEERKAPTMTNDLSCSCANVIREMLNNLLNDLAVHDSTVKQDGIEELGNEFGSSKSEFFPIAQDPPRPLISDVNIGANSTLSVNNEQVAFEIEDPREKFHSDIRVFTLDQFDDLIKSHLSPVDRRIRVIGKKADCSIKILGPYSSVHKRLIGNSRMKIVYYCHLISNSKEKGDKCLKCLQDSFPSMRLHEINLSSIYKQ